MEEGKGDSHDLLEPVLELPQPGALGVSHLLEEVILPKRKDGDQRGAVWSQIQYRTVKISKVYHKTPSSPLQNQQKHPINQPQTGASLPKHPLAPSPASPVLDGQADKSLPILQQQGAGSRPGIQGLLCPANDDGQHIPTFRLLEHVGCALLVGRDKP